tara:strand:- start:955 stop:2382 length:1428 start_codon:yes stop_codon:yes gene_type:complete
MKLGVIVPYRKRPTHLRKFQESIKEYLKDYDYELIIVEQADDLPFNRGKLLNIGFKLALRKQCDYVVFHDVDMLPVDVDYSFSEVPTHLATNFTNDDREIFKTYFGGVTLFPIELFKRINGYSNEYWGWGFEDDDLLLRCTEQKVFTDFELYDVSKESTSGLYLHGDESYIESKNNIKLNQDFTIHITFRPDEIIPEYDRAFDEYCVFSIPGWDTTISYNSFNRYKFECWDIGKECHQITSDYDYPKLTRITITYRSGDRLLTMYQDGEEIGHRRMTRRILDTEEDKFYIGVASIEREDDKKSFRGYVSDFAYWETCLEKNEVREINENSGMSFLYDNNQYGSSNRLKLYYDFKHSTFNNSYDYGKGSVVDLVHPRHYGNIYNCIPKNHKEIEKKRVSIPVRRKSTFEVLHHDNEGYGDGGWKYQSTRLNQIRYYDRVLNNRTKLHNDGLSNLKYQTNSRSADENYTILSVNLDP